MITRSIRKNNITVKSLLANINEDELMKKQETVLEGRSGRGRELQK